MFYEYAHASSIALLDFKLHSYARVSVAIKLLTEMSRLFATVIYISARAGHGLVCIGKFLYTAGGYNSVTIRNRCLLSAERYSIETNQWTKITSLESDVAHFSMIGNYTF